jgi:hypothetical protein
MLPVFGVTAALVAHWIRDDSAQYGIQTLVTDPSAGGRHQSQYHAGDRCVDPGCVHGKPDETAHQEVERKTAEAKHCHCAHDPDAKNTRGKRCPGNFAAIADGHHKNGTNIINDRQ